MEEGLAGMVTFEPSVGERGNHVAISRKSSSSKGTASGNTQGWDRGPAGKL